jgi:glycerol-3-phosphate dehydrogenase (NAD(P)+)
MVCAASNLSVAEDVCGLLQSAQLSVRVTDDVAGVETASAYKNVTAVAVGICEGLSESLSESAFVHTFANARAAVFALGLEDMTTLAMARGGRTSTILGLAGAGDLFVTCLGGRNGRLGRLLGVGETPAQAQATIGSTVEGVANARVAVALADRLGVDVPTARAVDNVLSERMSPEKAIVRLFDSFRASPDGLSGR